MRLAAGCLQDQTLSTEDTSVSSGWRALSRKGGRVTMVGSRRRYQALPFPWFPRPHINSQEGSGSLCVTEVEFIASPGEGGEGNARFKVT